MALLLSNRNTIQVLFQRSSLLTCVDLSHRVTHIFCRRVAGAVVLLVAGLAPHFVFDSFLRILYFYLISTCRKSLMLHIYYYYCCFIVLFLIGLDFLFITFFLHFFPSWTSSLSIISSAISTSTLSTYVLLGLTTDILPSTLISIHFITQSSKKILITCPYHLILPLLIIVVIGSTPTSFLNSSLILLCHYLVQMVYISLSVNNIYPSYSPTSHKSTQLPTIQQRSPF